MMYTGGSDVGKVQLGYDDESRWNVGRLVSHSLPVHDDWMIRYLFTIIS